MKNARSIVSLVSILLLASCAKTRVSEHADWGKYYQAQGIKNACFILRDNNHEAIHYYNKDRCIQRFLPASTFKIFNSLVALETVVAPDDQLVIKWDGVARRPDWDKDMNMREAFKVSCVPYYQEIARRIGKQKMQHYLDTTKYGNATIGGAIDTFWLDNSLQISADEQVGFLKRMYFNELPFSERSQRIVRSMMLREETPAYKLYYKTGWGVKPDNQRILWVVGFIERIQNVKEDKDAMNKSDVRLYPYFFAQNFDIAVSDTATKDWAKIRIDLVHQVLQDYGAMPK
ncbi:MAG: penicillin-binding transpeptidase domain-containing protein [Flavipsychrobacter sp.]|nr:penicillin-binding transpeptidase domain-containing protein [Flavipsychrobacter sp.]